MTVDDTLAPPEASGQPTPPADADGGPMTGLPVAKVVALVAAVAFLAGAIGFVVGERRGGADPLNDADVGFMQDMSLHHDQAVEMSIMLMDKDEVDPNLMSFATEIIIWQRFEQGIYTATLDRFGHSSDPGDTVMGWMGQPMPAAQMEGLATPEQLDALRAAEGAEAEALWIALMSEHHLAGLHMADHAARYGSDRTTVNIARATVRYQRNEVVDIQRYRTNNDLPIPEGFTDPIEDQRLNPISFADADASSGPEAGD